MTGKKSKLSATQSNDAAEKRLEDLRGRVAVWHKRGVMDTPWDAEIAALEQGAQAGVEEQAEEVKDGTRNE